MAITDKLTAIADAIRGKTGKTDALTLDQMATEIAGIQAGGGDELFVSYITGQMTEYSNSDITTLGEGAFACNNKITSVNLPNVTTIPRFTFYRCTKLVNCDLSNMTTVREGAFQQTGFTSLYLPKLTTASGDNCFAGMSSLTEATFPSLIYVPRMCFDYNTALEKLDLHVATGIDHNVNRNNTKFTTLIIRTPTVCNASNSQILANNCFANGTAFVYVPSNLVDSYKSATNWSKYADQIRAIEDYPEITGG